MPHGLPRALAFAALSLTLAAPAGAQVRAFQLTLDNDAYSFWIPPAVRPDWEYSNGVRLALELEGSPGWSGLASSIAPCAAADSAGDAGDAEAGCASTTIEVGQRLYSRGWTARCRWTGSAPSPAGCTPLRRRAWWMAARATPSR